MRKVLVTGGTVFVSRYIAEYYVAKGDEVYVLNRNTKKQSEGVHLIQADRHHIGEVLRHLHFDVVIDTGYTAEDVSLLLEALGSYENYIFISSGAVYPETEHQPFKEEANLGVNKFWGQYGLDKIEAETILKKRDPQAYILRPPYLYGPMNNVYREAFVFDCALADRKFYLPQDGKMNLQFYHVHDLCHFMDVLLETQPSNHVFNVGNREGISIRDWVKCCYQIVGKKAEFVHVGDEIEQRNYFSFYHYEYCLDVSKQIALCSELIPLSEGLKQSFNWYMQYTNEVKKKPFFDYIDRHLV